MATTNHKLKTAEAVKMVKAAPVGTRFAIHVRADAYIEENDTQVYDCGCSSYLNISRKDAVKLAGEMLSEPLEARGGRLRIAVSVSEYESDRSIATYWIG